MDIEKLIMDTFSEHEHLTPDSDTVFTAARQRIERRRSVLTRPLAVAAGVAVVILAAVTVVVLNRPADKVPVGAPTGTGPVPTTATATEPAMPALPMPFSLGWLPPGEVEYLVHRVNIGGSAAEPEKPVYNGEYMLAVTNGDHVINIDVQQMRQSSPEDAMFKSGPGRPVTINGLPGVESAVADGPAGYELYASDGKGGSLYVGVFAENGQTAPAQQLIDTGRRVAQSVRVPGDTTVAPGFGLRDLPAGLRICAFDVEKGFGPTADGGNLNTSYMVGACDVMPPLHISLTGKDPAGAPGQPVQGHDTLLDDEDGYHILYILDAVKGEPVSVAGSVPDAQLYDIANRLVLP
jgi:hypothetical protein